MARPSLFAELKRRHVYKVGAAYAVAGWLLVQIATQVFPFFAISNAAVRWVVLAVMAGFPLALALAWLFDLTPQGVVRTAPATAEESAPLAPPRRSGERRLNYLLGGLLVLALVYAALGHWVLAPPKPEVAAVSLDKSIAVLPFENLSDDHANAYFASGIQDEILTRLAGIGDLKVNSYQEQAYQRAENTYRQAIALDPEFALAIARLAFCQLSHRWFTQQSLDAAELADIQVPIDRALSLAPELAEAHLALGYFHYRGARDYPAATTAFQRALALQPSSAEAVSALAYIALSILERAASLAPRDSQLLGEYGLTLGFLHRYAEAREMMSRALVIEPNNRRTAIYLFRNELLGLGDPRFRKLVADAETAEQGRR